MRAASFLRTTNLIHVVLVLFAIVISFAVGGSVLFFRTPQSPLLVAGATLGALLAVVFLHDPVWATCVAIFIALLPGETLSNMTSTIPIIRNYPVLFGLLLACVFWLLGVVIHRRKIIWTSTNLAMLAYLVWCIITLFWAPDKILGRQNLMAYIVGFAPMMLLVNNIKSQHTLGRLMGTLALSGWILMLAGIGSILAKGYTPGARLEVLGMNSNGIGTLALVTMIGVLWQVLQPSQRHVRIKKLLSWIFLLMAIVLVAASGSRGSAISLLVTLLAFCFWKPTRAWGLLGLLVLAVGVVIAPLLFKTTLERFAITRGDTMLGGREVLWQATWNSILDHPWLGVGIGNARQALIPYVSLLTGVGGIEKAPTHNPVLQVWADTGLPGILLYLSVLCSAVVLFVQKLLLYRKHGAHALLPYFAIVSSTFLGYLASWIKGGGMEVSFTYFMMLALLLIPAGLHLEDRDELRLIKKRI